MKCFNVVIYFFKVYVWLFYYYFNFLWCVKINIQTENNQLFVFFIDSKLILLYIPFYSKRKKNLDGIWNNSPQLLLFGL